MKTKREESIEDIITSFQEMADIILGQLTLLEKIMAVSDEGEREILKTRINENEIRIDRYEVLISEKFDKLNDSLSACCLRYQENYGNLQDDNQSRTDRRSCYKYPNSIENIKILLSIQAMTEVLNLMLMSGISMVEKSLLSFINNDNEYAIWTIKNDEIVDEMNRKLLLNSISKSKVSSKTKEMLLSYMDLKNIITNLERIADHATNIAEASIYSIQGTDIRHSGPLTGPADNK